MLHRWLITLRPSEGTQLLNVNGIVVYEFQTSQSEDIFSSPNTLRTALGLADPPLQWVPGFRHGLKRPYNTEVETE